MPSTGFYSFLLNVSDMKPAKVVRVNALNGLLLISSEVQDLCVIFLGNVSMPSTGFYSFLQAKGKLITRTRSVSMPSTGFYSFLQRHIEDGRIEICRVSMPSTGFYSFLPWHRSDSNINGCNVSMPSTGFYSFLRRQKPKHQKLLMCVNALNGLLLISSLENIVIYPKTRVCQCPQRASTYFFVDVVKKDHHGKICVNALNGLLLISSDIPNRILIQITKVSMPSTGFYSFLRIRRWLLDLLRRRCQCPQRASTHFFSHKWGINNVNMLCQCPQRASTHFFE